MAKPTVIDAGRVVFSDATHLYFTPWTSEDALGLTSYDLVNIVGDTISIEQADNEINEKPHEFSDQPIFENITLGKWGFAATCIDFQNPVLKNLFGWNAEDSAAAFAPSQYKDIYCQIEIGFGADKPVVVLPKVKMNSKAVFSNLKTGTAEGMLSGTAYNAYVQAGEANAKCPLAIIPSKNASDYKVQATPFEVV